MIQHMTFLVKIVIFSTILQKIINGRRKMYLNQIAVQIEGSNEDVDRIARTYGFVNNGKVFKNFYAFTHPQIRKRSNRKSKYLHNSLSRESQVTWVEQQMAMERYTKGVDTVPPPTTTPEPNDPLWPEMWQLNNKQLGQNINVEKAWSLGFTGKGVVVAVVDDGLERNHIDLLKNYDQASSWDIRDNDPDPTPRYYSGRGDDHGTLCAGVIGAEYNNEVCGIGVAYGAKLGGIKLLNGEFPTDIMEAKALSYNRQYVDIYSNSWGPPDGNADIFDGPKRLALEALKDGVAHGRKGKGSIFVWASGNGGNQNDNCNCDGYNSNVYTITVSAATDHGEIPYYAEHCSSSLVTTYSSGGDRAIVSTDLHSKCGTHSATSAATPLAAGICALTLQANPTLTWRDMQHIVVRTAKSKHLKAKDWRPNGAQYNFSHYFGFGLMDAGDMVKLAQQWTTVPRWKKCSVLGKLGDGIVPNNDRLTIVEDSSICAKNDATNVVFLESVQARISLTLTASASKSEIEIILKSPQNTYSTVLSKRPRDKSKSGLVNWNFTTVHFWGEKASGHFTLEIHNDSPGTITLDKYELIIYGTSTEVGKTGEIYDGPIGHNPKVIEKCCSWWRNLCSGCADGFLLYRDSCTEKCPEGNYESRDKSNNKCSTTSCRKCAPPLCSECTGPESSSCTKCINGFRLDNSRCVKL